MRSAAWLAFLFTLLAPLSQACTTTTPSSQTLGFLQWDDDDHLVYGYAGEFFVANVTTGAVVPYDGNPGWPSSPPRTFPASPDGLLRLQLLRESTGGSSWAAGCQSVPAYRVLAVQLATREDAILQTWAHGNTTWTGQVWGNATHGFVYDQQASTFSSVNWSTGTVSTSPVTVPSGIHENPEYAPRLWQDRLLLANNRGQTVIDPDAARARTDAPLDEQTVVWHRGAVSVFVSAEAGSQFRHFVALDVATGQMRWNVTAPGGALYAVTARGVVTLGTTTLHRWVDGTALPTLVLPDQPTWPYAQLATGRERIAIGLPTGERLLVLDDDMEVLLDWEASELDSTRMAPTTTADPEGEGRSSPALPAAGLALLVLLAVVRRRIA